MSVLLAILWKDLVTEWRSRDRIAAMLLFSLLVVVIFHFSLPGGATRATQASAPGLLWIAYVFAALLGLNRSFSLELENDALSGIALSPVDRGWIFLGKAASNWLILGVVQAITGGVFALVFDVDLAPSRFRLAGVVALGLARALQRRDPVRRGRGAHALSRGDAAAAAAAAARAGAARRRARDGGAARQRRARLRARAASARDRRHLSDSLVRLVFDYVLDE